MNLETVIYHNPRCSKSRQTLALLQDKGISPQIVEYLKDGLDGSVLRGLIEMLKLKPSAILRKKEDAYEESGLDEASSEAQIIEAILKAPILLERPIVVHGKQAALGRPPENILSILK